MADRLAKLDLSIDERCRIFEACPPFLDLALFADRTLTLCLVERKKCEEIKR